MRRFVVGGVLTLVGVSILSVSSNRVLSQASSPSASQPVPATISQPLRDFKATPAPLSSEFVVIQGHITDIKGKMVTVHTFDIRPGCPLGQRRCPLSPTFMGTTFKVDTSQAVFQSPDSQLAQKQLTINQPIIVAGRPTSAFTSQEAQKNPPTIRAVVIEQVFVKGQLGYYPDQGIR